MTAQEWDAKIEAGERVTTRQIREDAIKEGMWRAAEIARKNQYSMVSQVQNYILAAAENLNPEIL